jgi:hypothetical protein
VRTPSFGGSSSGGAVQGEAARDVAGRAGLGWRGFIGRGLHPSVARTPRKGAAVALCTSSAACSAKWA